MAAMLKVGFKVCPIYHMSNTGIITEIYKRPVKVQMMGGTLSPLLIARVQMDSDQSIREFKISELMRSD